MGSGQPTIFNSTNCWNCYELFFVDVGGGGLRLSTVDWTFAVQLSFGVLPPLFFETELITRALSLGVQGFDLPDFDMCLN